MSQDAIAGDLRFSKGKLYTWANERRMHGPNVKRFCNCEKDKDDGSVAGKGAAVAACGVEEAD